MNIALMYGPSHSTSGEALKDKGQCAMYKSCLALQSTAVITRQIQELTTREGFEVSQPGGPTSDREGSTSLLQEHASTFFEDLEATVMKCLPQAMDIFSAQGPFEFA